MTRALRSTWVLFAALFVVRSAGFAFGILNIDESDYMVFGGAALQGELPYRDLGEVKPPLGYFTWIPAALFGGLHILPMRILGLFWVFANALVLRAAVRRWTRDETAASCAAWLSLLAALCELPSFGNEAMMNLPASLALLFFVRARTGGGRSDDLVAGLFVGVASLYKLQAAIEGAALGGAALASALRVDVALSRKLREATLRGLLLVSGFLFPWAIALGAWAALGALSPFVDWVFVRSFAYAGQGAAGSRTARFAVSTLTCASATLVPWWLALRASRRSVTEHGQDAVRLAGVAFLWLTWLPVSAGGRFYEHYYLQFVPALALVGAPIAAERLSQFHSLSRLRKTAWALGCALPLLGLTGYSWARGLASGYPAQEPRAVAIGAFLRAHSQPGDRLFVWGHYTPLYVLAQLLPGTRYPNTSVHMGNFDPQHLPEDFDPEVTRSDRDVALTCEDLERRRPRFVVDTAPADLHNWSKIPLAKFPALREYLDAHYREIGRPGGAIVLERRSQ